jgi:integrase
VSIVGKTQLDRGIFYKFGSYHYQMTDPITKRKVSHKVARGPRDDEKTIKEANAGKRTILNALDRNGVFIRRNVPFETVWTEFIKEGGKRGRSFKPSTVRDYTNIHDLYLEPFFKRHRIHEIQVAQIAAFKAHLETLTVAKRNARKDEDNPAPPEEVGKRRQAVALLLLKSILSYAHHKGYIVSNPGRVFSVEKSGRRVHYILSRKQAADLIAAADPFYETMLMTAVYSGARIGELTSVSWRSAELREDSTSSDAIALLHIVRNTSAGQVVDTTKTQAGHRDIPLPPKLAQRLIRHREEQRKCGFYKPDGLIFTNKHGGMLNTDTFRSRVFQKAKERAGLGETDLRIHDLRSTWITWLAENSVPSFLISRVAGHESASTTSGYIEARERQLKQIVDIFD